MNYRPGWIHLWLCDTSSDIDSAVLDYAYSILNDEEKSKLEKFVFKKDKIQYLMTRSLVRTTLSSYCGDIEPSEWRFNKNKNGKPEICTQQNYPDITFNLSHTKGSIILAISTGVDLGVDIEFVNHQQDVLDIAKHYFSKEEREYILTFQKEQRVSSFYKIWTMKEAHLKASGNGITVDLDKYSFTFGKTRSTDMFSYCEDAFAGYWSYWQVNTGNNYKAALAVRSITTAESHYIEAFKAIPGFKIEKYAPDIKKISLLKQVKEASG